MFEPATGPRLFGLPPGTDFAAGVIAGLRARLAGAPPEALARVDLLVNTRRMQRRMQALLAAEGALLMPRLRLVTEIADDPSLDLAPPIAPLRRRLELAGLMLELIDRHPDLAPRSAAFALADSLAGLLDEMQGEGVSPATLAQLDLSELSEHWARSRQILLVAERFFGAEAGDAAGRQRAAAEALAERWAEAPPAHPVIVAGSTGSRGATAVLMAAVARLPQGAVILPGFDFTMTGADWDTLDPDRAAAPPEDHPQFRFARLARRLGTLPLAVQPWEATAPPNPARNRLVSLALRPAPATDAWMREGPRLSDVAEATADVTLVEAESPRTEAVALALRLREAVERGETAALISPDRLLTRRVAAALDRWGIVPDDSAGRPLSLSPPGRFLLHVAELAAERPPVEALLAMLKHPLAHSGGGRNAHLLNTRDLELSLRRRGPPHPDAATLRAWAAGRAGSDAADWATWLADALPAAGQGAEAPLAQHVARHLAAAEALASGRTGGESELWRREAGAEARAAMDELGREAPHGPPMGTADYLALLRAVLEGRDVREPVVPHPGVMIWGTIEARVQGADLVLLAGLNDGIWPDLPPPDPWMNRAMRLSAGLLLPERRIGLAAHDFQQAVAARSVVLSRSRRDAEAETVPSRWLNRLTTLLGGIAPGALAAMRGRGAELLALAAALEDPGPRVPAARRPAPRPPVAARPRALSVTEVETLIRDPYAIYARHVLGLSPLDPLRRGPDARLRGSALHRVLETFVREVWDDATDPPAAFRDCARRVLAEEAPWPAARAAWAARLDRVADWFLEGEATRRREGQPLCLEVKGSAQVRDTGVKLTGKADRIDMKHDGRVVIYDYKTGKPPSDDEQRAFDKQLPLLAALARLGAFGGRQMDAAAVGYIGLTAKPELALRTLDEGEADEVWAGLAQLLSAFADPARGYPSRRAVKRQQGREAVRDYDHLARFGEWESTDTPEPGDVG